MSTSKDRNEQLVAEIVEDCCNWHDIHYKIVPRLRNLLATIHEESGKALSEILACDKCDLCEDHHG